MSTGSTRPPALILLLASSAITPADLNSATPRDQAAPSTPRPEARRLPALDQVRQARPTASFREVKNLSAIYGRGHFQLHEGRLWELLQDGRLLGYYFQGKGSLSYLSTEAVERSALQLNAERLSGFRVVPGPQEQTLQRAFTQATFWGTGLGLTGGTEPQPDPRPGKTAEAYLRHRFAFESPDVARGSRIAEVATPPRGGWPSHGHALCFGNDAAHGYVAVEMGGKGDPTLYRLMDGEARLEQLIAVRNEQWVPLSMQPVGWAWGGVAPRPFVVTQLDLEVDATAGTRAKVRSTERVRAQEDGLRVLAFQLRNYHSGVRFKDVQAIMRATSVQDGAGRALRFSHEGHCLVVELAEPLKAGETMDLTTTVEGEMLYCPGQFFAWSLSGSEWYPQPLNGSMRATGTLKARTPAPFRPVLPGTVVSETSQGPLREMVTRLEYPVDRASMAACNFTVHDAVRPERTVRTWTYFAMGDPVLPGWPPDPATLAEHTHAFAKAFAFYVAPLPFKHLNLLETEKVRTTGQGLLPRYSGLPMLPALGRNPISISVMDRVLVALADQYWRSAYLVACPEEEWIPTAFAQYLPVFLRHLEKIGTPDEVEEVMKVWRMELRRYAATSSLHTASWVTDPHHVGEAANAARITRILRGGLALQGMHKRMGDDGFLAFLKQIPRHLVDGYCTTRTLQRAAEAASGQDFSEYFEKHVWGTVIPD